MRAAFVLCVLAFCAVACRPTYFGDAVPFPGGCAQIGLDSQTCAAAD